MPQLHYFNPGHETAIWQGVKNYTPPANVGQMTRELAFLPVWYADANDFVFVEEETDSAFFTSDPIKKLQPFAAILSRQALKQRALPECALEAAPWGLSPHSIHLFEKLRADFSLTLSVPHWKDVYKQLTSRQTACNCLQVLKEKLPHVPLPSTSCFCHDIAAVERFMNAHPAPFVVKTPFSSSGRGLLWLQGKLTDKEKEWIKGALKKQGTVSVEPALDKRLDFAMEFHSDGKGEVTYEGLSIFQAEKRGAYSGNLLGVVDQWESYLQKLVGNTYRQIKDTLRETLSRLYGYDYTGYLGVDMLLYFQDSQLHIHPCVEINMRYTMGIVALHLSRNYVAPGSHGAMYITFDARPGEAYRQHLQMQAAYPLVIEGHRAKKGYLSLCPVTADTKYRAYLLLDDNPYQIDH